MTQPKTVLMVVTSHSDIDAHPSSGIWFTEFSEPFAALHDLVCR